MFRGAEPLPPAPVRAPDLDDDFSGDLTHWVTAYLAHWTTPERAEARFDRRPDGLALRIDEDQLDWRPEDAPLRVSNLQSGTFSEDVGSERGTHRHRPDGLLVRTPTPLRLLFAPERGRVEVTMTASGGENCMTAAWLVGTEHLDEADSGEICIVEIDADAVGAHTTRVRSGIKSHHDPRLTTDMTELDLALDGRQQHTWTAMWEGGQTVIGCDGVVIRRMPQAPDYPLFLMLDLFELRRGGEYPKRAVVHRVRGWSQ